MNRARISPAAKVQVKESLLLEGDVSEALPFLPDASVQCIITSPPYWGLRDYGIRGQIGLEPTLAAYLYKLTSIFTELRRILKPDGILWLNIGDGYTSGNRGWRAPDKKNPNRAMSVRPDNPPGLKDKDLLGVPWRLAFALQADGWYLRSDIIWHKPNCQPESVKDRPTRSHEYVFLFSKSEDYFYDHRAILEPATSKRGTRNRRTVWSINTEPLAEAIKKTVDAPAFNLERLNGELSGYVDSRHLKRLASFGLRGEVCFCVPYLFTRKPYLLGYCRLLYGFSCKEFYDQGPFKSFQ